jgi:hypothetical protein
MVRLGEQLIAAGLVTPDKLEQALRAQVVWGGRLGTNLIEIGCIDLDELSRALGQQHGVPAALERHVENADPALQAQLPAEIAGELAVVPLVRLSPQRIAVVALEPLRRDAMEAIAKIYGVDPRDGIIASVAPELRVLYHLERVYGVLRPPRYKRIRGMPNAAMPELSFGFELDAEEEPEFISELTPIDPDPTEENVPVFGAEEADAIVSQIDQAIETSGPIAVPGELAGKDRRSYLRTLGDDVEAALKAPTEPPMPGQYDSPSVRTLTGALGRLALRKVAVRTSAAVEGSVPSATFADAIRAIKRGSHRDRVAELVIEALDKFVPTCVAGLLLVIRGEVAIGWKYFARDEVTPPEIAVPLDKPGIVPAVVGRKQTGRARAEDLGPIDQLLWRELGGKGVDLVASPIHLGEHVLCVIAAATEPNVDVDPIEEVAHAAGLAFARLLRDASR